MYPVIHKSSRKLLILVTYDYEITVKEALHIKFKRPTVNKQLFTQGTPFVLSIFLVIGQLCMDMHEEQFKVFV